MSVDVQIIQGKDQIGGNCVYISNNHSAILLDVGIPVNALDDPDYTEPDIPLNIKAVFITHYHIDHWGLIDKIPTTAKIYIGRKSKDILLLQEKLLQGKTKSRFLEAICFEDGEKIEFEGFEIIPRIVDHSAMDAYSFEILADGKRILYTGDFRRHGRKAHLWKKWIEMTGRPIDILICEGTAVGSVMHDFYSETEIEHRCTEALQKHQSGLALAWCATTNFDRITSLYKAASRSNRLFVIDVYTANLLDVAAEGTGLPCPSRFENIRVYFPIRICNVMKDNGHEEYIKKYGYKKITKEDVNADPHRFFLLTRPSLYRHWLDRLTEWDNSILFYSLWSGYRTKKDSSEFLENLKKKGCNIDTLHTGGHADTKAILDTIEALSPGTVFGIHTYNPDWFEQIKTSNQI